MAGLYLLMLLISLTFQFLAPRLGVERFSFYSPITRYWEFCLGALIFIANRLSQIKSQSNVKKKPFVTTLLFVVLINLLFFGPHSPVIIFAIVVFFYRVIFYSLDTASPKSLVKFARYLGDRSYSIYLVHMPLIWIFSYSPILFAFGLKEKTGPIILLSVFLTLLLGVLLYELIEVKYRDSSYRLLLGRRIVLKRSMWVATFLLGIIGLGLIAESQNFWLQRTVLARPANQMDAVFGEDCHIMDNRVPCIFPSNATSLNFFFMGDSHAGSFAKSFVKVANSYGSVRTLLQSGCQYTSLEMVKLFTIQDPRCALYSDYIRENLLRLKFDGIIVSYRSIALSSNGERMSLADKRIVRLRSLYDLKAKCKCKVIYVGPSPEFPIKPDFFSPDRLLILGSESAPKQFLIKSMPQIPFQEDRFWIDKLINTKSSLSYISMISVFCGKESCNRWGNGWLYSDFNHISSLGAKKIEKLLEDALRTNFLTTPN